MSLIIDERLEGGWLVVSVIGDLDIYTAGELRAGLMAALTQATGGGVGGAGDVGPPGAGALRGVVVDLSAVSFMDSAGLGVLVGVYKRATADRTALRLAGATEQVMRLFEMTGLSRVLALHPSVDDARRPSVGG